VDLVANRGSFENAVIVILALFLGVCGTAEWTRHEQSATLQLVTIYRAEVVIDAMVKERWNHTLVKTLRANCTFVVE
jgi:hypothetical protein